MRFGIGNAETPLILISSLFESLPPNIIPMDGRFDPSLTRFPIVDWGGRAADGECNGGGRVVDRCIHDGIMNGAVGRNRDSANANHPPDSAAHI